ncbi:M1 family metallopeptidase [Nocardioides panacisoli]|uniref:M1 family metallopeptidase n=1 Tax=Nocardioides panacisoli TaxID=627624 RepID=UPI001C6387BD|nr:M1 family metallopeptidase [Nocardioides panacisoli]QYJ02965.1 M1 family metallopeptidase [Nocardioides panacisoli]
MLVRARLRSTALGTAALVLLAACSTSASEEASPTDPSASASAGQATEDGADDELAVALSEPREDSVYPESGDPGVDALHYRLDLTWQPKRRHLDAVEEVTLRATEDARELRLDLSDALTVTAVRVDGRDTDWTQGKHDLRIHRPVERDERYVVQLAYEGTPRPATAPTERSDFDGLGWHVTDSGETWTMQEPYGAHTWYAVNDQPADKALYDFTLTVPAPWTGIANGELTGTTEQDGRRTTTWHLSEPASSYLTTVAFGDYTAYESESESGVPVTVWSPTGRGTGDQPLGETGYTAEALDWAEDLLGPYPFDTLGAVIVDSASAMETQTMMTLGDAAYPTSRPVVVHEVVHQWYGNTVSPADWSDVWMNEGMTMYLQWWWEAEHGDLTLEEIVTGARQQVPDMRSLAGPPAAYDPDNFGQSNIYFIPAIMWHELRQRIGEEAFREMLRAWPEEMANSARDRDEYVAWVEEQTGAELTDFFEGWLLGDAT